MIRTEKKTVKYRKAIMAILVAIILLIIFLIVFLFGYFMDGTNGTEEVYSWKEFENLTAEQQMEFQNSFETQEDFEKWMEEAQNVKIPIPWENGGKKPKNYTWEEFELLTPEQQIKFQNSFKKVEDFEKWMERAQEELGPKNPWENENKKPKDYTWEEFEVLTAEQQIAFQNSFKSQEKFDEWLQSVTENAGQEENTINLPWENGGKQPKDYTWEEFEALVPEQQIAFQNAFENQEDFEKWMDSVTDKEEAEVSFNKDDLFSVTWEEFEAMTGEEQMIFQNSFGGFEEFDKWLQANEPK